MFEDEETPEIDREWPIPMHPSDEIVISDNEYIVDPDYMEIVGARDFDELIKYKR